MRKFFERIRDWFIKFTGELKILFYLFQKENVFRYFLIIFLLMIASGLLFMVLEKDRLLAALPAGTQPSYIEKLITVFYWAIVTVATCGYGDISPGTNAGRIMVIVVLYLSIMAVSLFTANLASALTTKKMMERRGIMDLSEMKDHFVICGWKNAMNKILSEIFYTNEKLPPNKIIIIANIEPDDIELFHQQYPEYQQINILRGEHYNETLLRKANVQNAQKVIILADESTVTSPTEVDSKTIMAAMSIRAISINVRICAELLDAKFEKYLKSSFVEDIIYTNEYSKVLIANVFTRIGITKVVNDLLNIHTPAFIFTDEVPKTLIGKNFLELQQHYKNKKNSIAIGLLENVGTYMERKDEAVREGQKTADIGQLIDNLKKAKNMENNFPNINPGDSYPVPKNSMAILVVRQDV